MANQLKFMRQLLLDMLEEESWIEMVGEATQESEIRELVEKTAADLSDGHCRQVGQAVGHLA